MRVIYYFLKAISSIVVPLHRSFIYIRFLGNNSFSTINKSQRINLDIPSLKKQLPKSAISFYTSYKSPLFKIYICPKTSVSSLGLLSSKCLVLPYNLPVENLAQSIILISAYKKMFSLQNQKEFKAGSYVLFFNPFSYANIAHWLTEALVKIWTCKDILQKNDQFLIPKSNMTEFAIDSIKALGFKNKCIVHDTSKVIFQKVKVINSSGRQAEFDPCLLEIRKTILEKTNNSVLPSKKFYVLYVKRHKNSKRKIINEREMLELLKSKFEVKVIDPSQLSFSQQVSEFSKTKCVISVHGAALSNMIWMKEGSHVIELFKDIQSYDGNFYGPPNSPSHWYSRLSAVMNLNYHLFQCIPPKSHSKMAVSPLIVDCEKLNKLVEKIYK